MAKIPKTIAVFDPENKYLSHCTWKRASKLLSSRRAIRVNATTIKLTDTKKERIRKKHSIIEEANRICYICNKEIPESEIATIDHIIPKSRHKGADTYENMKCCCNKCNNDKGSMKLSEYVRYIYKHRALYPHITDKRLTYLSNFAKFYEEEFYESINVHTRDLKMSYKNVQNKKNRRRFKR